MPDDSTNPVYFEGDETSARSSNRMIRRAQAKSPPAPGHAGRGKLRQWHRSASVIELLVALGIIFFALARIITARGEETSFSPTLTPIAEMRSLSLGTTNR